MQEAGNAAFYDFTALWWGTTEVTDRDRRRAGLIDAVPNGPHRVLELGAGFGGSAAATADLGHHVVAIERSPQRAALARRHEWRRRSGTLEIIETDFADVHLEGPFDVVAFWSGFGSGGDVTHRQILERIRVWLRPGGRAFVDVFDALWWTDVHGTESVVAGLHRVFGFDPRSHRLSITCWPQGRPNRTSAEIVRCYSPAEIAELAAHAGLLVLEPEAPRVLGRAPSYLTELAAP